MKKIFLSLVVVFLLVSCTQNDVAIVKDGTMTGYETTTIGKAFDTSFDEPKWEAFETDKGQRVVQFTGKISATLQQNWIEYFMAEYRRTKASGNLNAAIQIRYAFTRSTPYEQLQAWEKEFKQAGHQDPNTATLEKALPRQKQWQVGTPVIVQWFISTDGATFQLGAWKSEAWIYPSETRMPINTILNCVYR